MADLLEDLFASGGVCTASRAAKSPANLIIAVLLEDLPCLSVGPSPGPGGAVCARSSTSRTFSRRLGLLAAGHGGVSGFRGGFIIAVRDGIITTDGEDDTPVEDSCTSVDDVAASFAWCGKFAIALGEDVRDGWCSNS